MKKKGGLIQQKTAVNHATKENFMKIRGIRDSNLCDTENETVIQFFEVMGVE